MTENLAEDLGKDPAGTALDPVLRESMRAAFQECARYADMSPEERDQEIQLCCRTAMSQWLALPEAERVRWPPEPGPEGEAILKRWMSEWRAAHPETER